jgi:hypothetical protein
MDYGCFAEAGVAFHCLRGEAISGTSTMPCRPERVPGRELAKIDFGLAGASDADGTEDLR